MSILGCSATGGGTWCNGTSLQPGSGGIKNCYSNYVHPSNYHSSTAVLGPSNSKRFASAGYWSNANVIDGLQHTCYTYWNNQA